MRSGCSSYPASSKGIIIPTAIFVAMTVLVLVTVLVGRVSHDLDNSLRSVVRTEQRYLSFGAANQLLSDLNRGRSETTLEERHGSLVTRAWIEPMDENGAQIVVAARTNLQGRGEGEVVRRLARLRRGFSAQLYTNGIDTDKESQSPIFYSSVEGWKVLKKMPVIRYGDDGSLFSEAGQIAGSIPLIAGARDGSLYALYAPTLDEWNEQGLTTSDLMPATHYLTSFIDSNTPIELSRGALVARYSHLDGRWSALPPAPEAVYDGNRFVVDEGNYWIQGVAGPMAADETGVTVPLSRKGQDAVYRWSDESNSWSVFRPPGQDILALAGDQGGTTYVQSGSLAPGTMTTLLDILSQNLRGHISPRRESTPTLHGMSPGGEWRALPDPPSVFLNQAGELVGSEYGPEGPHLSNMVGGEEGELYVVNRPHHDSLRETIYRYRDGTWTFLDPPQTSITRTP